MKVNDFVQEKVLPVAAKISANKFLKAISNSFMSLMPVIIIGSVFSLFNGIAIPSYQDFIKNMGLKSILEIPNMVTNDILSIYVAFFVAFHLAKEYKKDQGVAGMIALATFLSITPVINTGNAIRDFLAKNNIIVPEDIKIPGINAISYNWIGAKGLFVAIIIAILSTVIYSKLQDKGLAIKLPESVPSTIGKSFAGLIPGFIVVIIFLLLNRLIISNLNSEGIHGLIYNLLQSPGEKLLGNNIYSFVIAMGLAQLLWFFGIHGVSAIILPIFMPLWTSLTLQNIEAMNNGVSIYELPNIINRSFFSCYVGAHVITLGLCIYMAYKAKAKQFKILGKIALFPNVCGINEPIMYGVPAVLNPYMFIPLVGTVMLSAVLAYIFTAINILPRLTTIVPLGTPIIMSGLLAGGTGGWRVALFQIFLLLVNGAVWVAFFKIVDKKALSEELLEEEKNNEIYSDIKV